MILLHILIIEIYLLWNLRRKDSKLGVMPELKGQKLA